MAADGKAVARDDRPLAVRMAHAVAACAWESLSHEVVAKAKLCIYDLLSSALASGELPWSQQAAAVARRNSGGTANGAGIIGTRDVVAVQDAAFANGVLGHSLVRDDMHIGSVSHLGTVLVPALLALSAARKTSGKDFMTALVAGYEVGGKFGRMILDVDVSRIFRPTGITGPIAAAAAGARLLGLNAEQTATAIALGANAAAGYNEWAATGGSEMFFQTGFAARSAVTAVQLAAEGAYASRTAIDGEAGILAAFRKSLQPTVPELFADRTGDPGGVLQARAGLQLRAIAGASGAYHREAEETARGRHRARHRACHTRGGAVSRLQRERTLRAHTAGEDEHPLQRGRCSAAR